MISELGNYRGSIVDAGVSQTTNGYPQFVVELKGEQIYDEENETWVPVDEPETITAYLVLFGGNGKETLNSKQVKKAFGWDGVSFKGLALADYSDTKAQFRVEEEEYEGSVSIQVAWVDEYDAEPGRKISKLDDKGLKDLDAKYAKQLQNSGTKKATKAKPKARAKPKKKAKPERKNDDIGGKCSSDEAWEEATDEAMRKDGVSDDDVAEIWLDVTEKVVGDKADEDITPEEWFKIKEAVKDKVYKF